MTLTLCSFTQLKLAKREMVENQYLDQVIDLLATPDQFIKLNSVQLIANLAEHPKGREKFLQEHNISKLLALRDDESFKEFRDCVCQALDVINFVP